VALTGALTTFAPVSSMRAPKALSSHNWFLDFHNMEMHFPLVESM
jgi:hypothetical protein